MDVALLAELKATIQDQLRIALSQRIIGIGEEELSDETACILKCMLEGRKQGFSERCMYIQDRHKNRNFGALRAQQKVKGIFMADNFVVARLLQHHY